MREGGGEGTCMKLLCGCKREDYSGIDLEID